MTSLRGRSMTAASICSASVAFVEKGLMSDDDYREFVFSNAARLYAGFELRFLQRHGNRERGGKSP